MQALFGRRVAAALAIVGVVAVSIGSIGWTLGLLRPESDDLVPIPLRIAIVFFTFEATRMFIHVLVAAAFYQCAEWPEGDWDRPLVSVIIPAWNEEVGLAKTVDSVLASDYEPLELIIVDDGSTDRTPHIARQYADSLSSRVFLIVQENGGKGSALNNGVLHALGDVIVNVDADSAVEPDAIGNMVKAIVGGADAVVGRIVVGNTQHLLGRAQAFEYIFGFHLRRAQSVFNTIFILSGAMCAYRRSAFLRTAGFRDFSMTEDMDFSLQLRAAGLRLVYADDAVCHTEGAADLAGLRHQRTRWRYGAFRCFCAHRSLFFDITRGNRALGFYELPFSLLGYVQILLYPIVAALAFALPIFTHQYIYLALVLASVPANFAIVFWTSGTLRRHARQLVTVIALMVTTMAVEHLTMWWAIAQLAGRRSVGWTSWERLGVHGPAESTALREALPSVRIPDAVVAAMTSGFPSEEALDRRIERELQELLDLPHQPATRADFGPGALTASS